MTPPLDARLARTIAEIVTPHVCGPFVLERRGHRARRGTVLCAGCGRVFEEHVVTLAPQEAS